jgi:hypothetical protein
VLLLRCVVCASGFTASHSHSTNFMCSFSRWCPARDVVRGGGVGVVLQVGALRDRLAGLRHSITEASSRQQRGTEQQQHRLAALARDSKDVDSRLQACLSRVAEAEVLSASSSCSVDTLPRLFFRATPLCKWGSTCAARVHNMSAAVPALCIIARRLCDSPLDPRAYYFTAAILHVAAADASCARACVCAGPP